MKKIVFDKKNTMYIVSFLALFIIFGISIFFSSRIDNELSSGLLYGTVVKSSDSVITICDDNGNYYTINGEITASVGDNISLTYSGMLDINKDIQDVVVTEYTVELLTSSVPTDYDDNGIFSDYYDLAYNKLLDMSLEEKIGQLLLVRYPDSKQIENLKEYGFAGYVFYEDDFKDKKKSEIVNMISELQDASSIPLLTATDEEGGKVVRVSSNTNLREEPFLSSSELYALGGFDKIEEDTKEKSKLLKSLGINVNLAPVVDVSTDNNDYIYERTLKEDTNLVSEYAKTVIEASHGTGVSYTLKHFPGYGNNTDTHTGTSVDNRSLEDIMSNDIPPFEAGIEAGAGAVLISHSIVNSIDMANPASLSPNVHSLLRDELGFTGIIITDDIDMEATDGIEDGAVFAVKAGNNLIITTNYEDSYNSILNATREGEITESEVDKLVFKVLAWKYYKGLMFDIAK